MDRQLRAGTTAAKTARFRLLFCAVVFGCLAALSAFGSHRIHVPGGAMSPVALFVVPAIGYAAAGLFLGRGSKAAWLAATSGNLIVVAAVAKRLADVYPHSLTALVPALLLLVWVAAGLLASQPRAVFGSLQRDDAGSAAPAAVSVVPMSAHFTWSPEESGRVPSRFGGVGLDVLPARDIAPATPIRRFNVGEFADRLVRTPWVAVAVASTAAFGAAVALSSAEAPAAVLAASTPAHDPVSADVVLPRALEAAAAQPSVVASAQLYSAGVAYAMSLRVNGGSTEVVYDAAGQHGDVRDTPTGHFTWVSLAPGQIATPGYAGVWVHSTVDTERWRQVAQAETPVAKLRAIHFSQPPKLLPADNAHPGQLGIQGLTAQAGTGILWVDARTFLPVEWQVETDANGVSSDWKFSHWASASPVLNPPHWIDKPLPYTGSSNPGS